MIYKFYGLTEEEIGGVGGTLYPQYGLLHFIRNDKVWELYGLTEEEIGVVGGILKK